MRGILISRVQADFIRFARAQALKNWRCEHSRRIKQNVSPESL